MKTDWLRIDAVVSPTLIYQGFYVVADDEFIREAGFSTRVEDDWSLVDEMVALDCGA